MSEQPKLDFEPHKLAGKHDPITSHDAAHAARELRSRHHATILDTLDAGAMTSEEIADATPGLEHWAITRRMGELRDAGLVIQTHDQRPNRSGRRAFVWRKADASRHPDGTDAADGRGGRRQRVPPVEGRAVASLPAPARAAQGNASARTEPTHRRDQAGTDRTPNAGGGRMTRMKLSEAIKQGIPSVPGGARSYFNFAGATGSDYAEGIAHHKPLACADALGTAIVGLAGDPTRAAEECYEGPYGGPHSLLTQFYPELRGQGHACPVCHNATGIDMKTLNLVGLVWHLQDAHGWSREQMAAWLQKEGH